MYMWPQNVILQQIHEAADTILTPLHISYGENNGHVICVTLSYYLHQDLFSSQVS